MPNKTITKRERKATKFALGVIENIFKLTRLPGMSHHPWLRSDKTDMRWLPINEDIQMPENAPMPLTLLDRLIEEASHRVIWETCGCRVGYSCKDYPEEIGCLMMGDSAVECHLKGGREVGVDEAKAHARKAVEAGLVPVVGKARIDNALFLVKDRGRLLTTCFCCECCCITRFNRHVPFKLVEPIFRPLDGITVTVTDECRGCGKCAKHCYVEAIRVVDKRAVIGEVCRACGRCATVCPEGAIEIAIDDPRFLEKAYASIRSHVTFD